MYYLTKELTAEGTGVTVAHHAIARIELDADLLTLQVHLQQWPNESARIAGATPSGYWRVPLQVAALDLAAGLGAGVRAAVLEDAAFAGGAWAPGADGTVAVAKMRALAAIEVERERRLQGTFISGGREFDLRRSANLSGAVLDAVIATAAGESFEQFWVLADDTSATLTAAETIGAGRAAKALITSLWQTGQGLREQITAIDDETGTLAEVAAVQWPE